MTEGSQWVDVEDVTLPHQYWISYAHPSGFGAIDMGSSRPIQFSADLDMIIEKIRMRHPQLTEKDVVILSWTKFERPEP